MNIEEKRLFIQTIANQSIPSCLSLHFKNMEGHTSKQRQLGGTGNGNIPPLLLDKVTDLSDIVITLKVKRSEKVKQVLDNSKAYSSYTVNLTSPFREVEKYAKEVVDNLKLEIARKLFDF